MLNLAVYTKLKPEEALERAKQFFFAKHELTPVELVAHFHSETGAAEVRVIGKEIEDGTTHLSEEVFASQIKHLADDFDFELVHYALHAHASPNPELGHLLVYIRAGETTEVDFESFELDYQVRQFVDKLPTVKPRVPAH